MSCSLQLVPGHLHSLSVCLQVSAPGVSWATSFPLALRVPCEGLSDDVIWGLAQGVTYPAPSAFLNFFFYGQLVLFSAIVRCY